MIVKFNDDDYLELISTGKGLTEYVYDRSFSVRLVSDISAINKQVWVDGHDLEHFIESLQKLQKTLKGETVLTSESPGELLLHLKPVDNLGHFLVKIEIGIQSYIGSEVCWQKGTNSFPLASEELSKVCEQIITYLRCAIDA